MLIGAAVALTLAPLVWIAGFVRTRHIAFKGDWLRAVAGPPCAAWSSTLLIVLRAQDALSLPMAIFVIAMPVLVELISLVGSPLGQWLAPR